MADDKSSPPSTPDTTSVAQIQEAAKWLVATLGAIAAVMVAGLSFANLGNLTGERLGAAIAGTVAASVGVFWLLYETLRVLAVAPVTLADVGEKATDSLDATVISPAATPQELASGVSQRITQSHEAYARHLVNTSDAGLRNAYETAHAEAQLWLHAGRKAIDRVRLSQARNAFDQIRSWLWLKALLVLAGIGLAGWGLTGPESRDLTIGVVTRTPVNVLVDFEPVDFAADDVAGYASQLGEECVNADAAHEAVAIGVSGDQFTIVLLESDECPAELITVNPATGKVALPPEG